jgi:hypothetical protein
VGSQPVLKFFKYTLSHKLVAKSFGFCIRLRQVFTECNYIIALILKIKKCYWHLFKAFLKPRVYI